MWPVTEDVVLTLPSHLPLLTSASPPCSMQLLSKAQLRVLKVPLVSSSLRWAPALRALPVSISLKGRNYWVSGAGSQGIWFNDSYSMK